jgi:two-component system NarL family response regulator
VRIIALSGYCERIYISEMIEAGVNGYIVKSGGADELVAGIRAVAGGYSFFSPQVSYILARRPRDNGPGAAAPPLSVLGKREKEVLRLVAGGNRSGTIGTSLGITAATVDVHRRNIKDKLGLYSTADLTRYAIREGLISS